jgi:hypothetical protein
VPRKNLEVSVVGGLSGSGAHIEADGEAVGGHPLLEVRLDAVDQEPARPLLALGEIEIVRYVSLRKNECVTLGYRIWGCEGNGLSGFRNDRRPWRGGAEFTFRIAPTRVLRIGPILVNLAELGAHHRFEGQLHRGLVRGDAVLVVLSIARALKIPTHGVEGRAGWAEILGNIHEHIRLLSPQEHIQDVVAKNSVERALGAFWCVVGIVSFYLEALLSQKIDVGSVSAAEIKHAAVDTSHSEELPSWK